MTLAADKEKESDVGGGGKTPSRSGASSVTDQVQMDELAYSSRMLSWPPLGKLMLTLFLLFVGLFTDSIIVPMITFCIGICLMVYSTNMRLPLLIAIAILEAVAIMVLGSGMISIMGDHHDPAIFQGHILWFDAYMTVESFNKAWLIFFRAIAGVTLMLSFASSTPIPHLALACRRLHVPREITELIVLVYRYAFLLLERMLVMISAAKCRLGYNGPLKTMKSYAGAMVGTFIFSMEIAEKSEATLACRNYRGFFPIYRMPAKVTWPWPVISVVSVVALYVFGMYTADVIDMYKLFAPLLGW